LRDTLGTLPSILNRPRDATGSRTRTDHKLTLCDGLIKGFNYARVVEDVSCGRSAPDSLWRGIFQRRYEREPRQTHIFHRARDAADIATVSGINQNDVDILGIHTAVSLVWSARIESRGQRVMKPSLTSRTRRPE